MVDYQPIAELVKQIPADTWKILQEIQKRRPAMMLHELLDKRERAPKQPRNAQARKDRGLTGGVDDPQPDRHAGKIAIRSEFLGSLSAFQLGRLAATPDHNVG